MTKNYDFVSTTPTLLAGVVPNSMDIKESDEIDNEKMPKRSDRNFLALMLGIFAIFLLWSAFTRFEEVKVYDETVIIGAFLGGVLLTIAWKQAT